MSLGVQSICLNHVFQRTFCLSGSVMRASHALRHREIVVSPALMVQRGDCNVHGYILGYY